MLMMGTLDALHRLFTNDTPLVARLRTAGMSLVNRAAPVKRTLIRRALGLSEEERERLAEEAITFTRRHHSREEMCAQTLALYEEVLRQSLTAEAS